MAYADWGLDNQQIARRGLEWLSNHQNADGGWGGGLSVPYRVAGRSAEQSGSSVEETDWR